MSSEEPSTRRRPRADSIRNRGKLLETAAEVFSSGDTPASLEAVARKAGLGIGTLYRHFPTRESLFEAVYRREVDHLGDLAEALSDGDDPVEALRTWVRANVRVAAAKRGMIETLQLAAFGSPELKAYSGERMLSAAKLLIDRAASKGCIRSDISAEDLLRVMAGIIYAPASANWQDTAQRLLDVFLDGLRAR